MFFMSCGVFALLSAPDAISLRRLPAGVRETWGALREVSLLRHNSGFSPRRSVNWGGFTYVAERAYRQSENRICIPSGLKR